MRFLELPFNAGYFASKTELAETIMSKLKRIGILFICLCICPIFAHALTDIGIAHIDAPYISATDDVIDGQVVELTKPEKSNSCWSHLVKLKVIASIKGRFHKGDEVNVYLTAIPDTIATGDTIFIAITQHNNLYSPSGCPANEIENTPKNPTYIDSRNYISFAKITKNSPHIKFEACGTKEVFLYEELFLKQGYKLIINNKKHKSCRYLKVPRGKLIGLINADLGFMQKALNEK